LPMVFHFLLLVSHPFLPRKGEGSEERNQTWWDSGRWLNLAGATRFWMQINSSKLPIKLELSLILWSPNDLASPSEVNPTPQQHQPLRFLKLNKTIFLSSTSFDLFNLNLLYVTFTQLLLFFWICWFLWQ
jgi:hypothetical protein